LYGAAYDLPRGIAGIAIAQTFGAVRGTYLDKAVVSDFHGAGRE
jgi:hypothetical protein